MELGKADEETFPVFQDKPCRHTVLAQWRSQESHPPLGATAYSPDDIGKRPIAQVTEKPFGVPIQKQNKY